MSVFIKLTNPGNRTPLYLRAQDIRTVEKNPQNPLSTVVMTSLITPRGPAIYEVVETQEEVMRLVDSSLEGKSPIALG